MSMLMCVGTHMPGRSLRFAVFTLPPRPLPAAATPTGGRWDGLLQLLYPPQNLSCSVSSQPRRSWYGPASPVSHAVP